jgi:hypothetical protein
VKTTGDDDSFGELFMLDGCLGCDGYSPGTTHP